MTISARIARWRDVGSSPAAKRTVQIIGAVAFLLSLIYLGLFAQRNWQSIVQVPKLNYEGLALAFLLYGLAHPFSAGAWVMGLRGLRQSLPFVAGIRIGLITQIGKYLPGNVAHHFARAGLAAASGVKLTTSGIATLVEVVAALLAASLVASSAMLLDPSPVQTVHAVLARTDTLQILLLAGAISGALVVLRLFGVPLGAVMAATILLAVNFVLTGLSFYAVASSMTGEPVSPLAIIGIFAVAWAAGFVIPGAPAGLGVREVVLVAWLGPIIGPGLAVACSLIHRLVTACVDAMVALLAYGWLQSSTTSE